MCPGESLVIFLNFHAHNKGTATTNRHGLTTILHQLALNLLNIIDFGLLELVVN